MLFYKNLQQRGSAKSRSFWFWKNRLFFFPHSSQRLPRSIHICALTWLELKCISPECYNNGTCLLFLPAGGFLQCMWCASVSPKLIVAVQCFRRESGPLDMVSCYLLHSAYRVVVPSRPSRGQHSTVNDSVGAHDKEAHLHASFFWIPV